MRMHLVPNTKAGKWAVGFTLAFIVFLAIQMTTSGALPLPTLVIALLGMIGFIVALVAFIKYKDRAILTLLSLVLGLLLTFWILAEIAFPH